MKSCPSGTALRTGIEQAAQTWHRELSISAAAVIALSSVRFHVKVEWVCDEPVHWLNALSWPTSSMAAVIGLPCLYGNMASGLRLGQLPYISASGELWPPAALGPSPRHARLPKWVVSANDVSAVWTPTVQERTYFSPSFGPPTPRTSSQTPPAIGP